MTELQNPKQNKLLAALPDDEYARVAAQLELVSLPLGESIYESGDKIEYIHFPINCILSLLYVMKNGASAEIAVAGNEGLVGIALFMGGGQYPQPGGGTKRWLLLPDERGFAEARI